MIEIWGRTAAIRYSKGRLITTPLRADDEVPLDVGVADLCRAGLARTEDDRLAVLLFFRSPDFCIAGRATQHHPVPVFLEPEQRNQAMELVEAIEFDVLELRRRAPERPDLVPPQPVRGLAGPKRPDVTAAAQRMLNASNSTAAIGALHSHARLDEYVLELAQSTYAQMPGLVAITTQRFLFIAEAAAHEFPVAVLDGAEVSSQPGSVATLRVTGAGTVLEFIDWEPVDFVRLAQALELARDIGRTDGSVEPFRPSSADLFAEWQLLTERRKLGMVEDEPFQRQASGIMAAL